MSTTTDQEVHQKLRSERRWALADKIARWVVCISFGIILIGLASAATIVMLDACTIPDHGVMDQ